MTKSIVRGLVGAALLTVAGSGAAYADGSYGWNVCGGNQFSTCASVQVTVVGTHVTMRAWNLSGLNGTHAGTIFTGIGLFNVPANVDLAANPNFKMYGPKRPGTNPGQWVLYQNKQIGGGIKLDLVPKTANGVNSGIANGCAPSSQLPGSSVALWMNPCGGDMTDNANWVTFEFDVDETWDPATSQLLVKGQNGPNGWSTECITGATGNCPTSVVPEPVTMALLGTGLAGMGGVGLLRRRRQRLNQE